MDEPLRSSLEGPVADSGASGPKERFTALDVRALARDLRSLERPRVDKAFDYGTSGWILSFRGRAEGRRDLVLEPGRFAALLEEGPPHPEAPGPFARDLRKHLAGSVLGAVADPAGERTLSAEFVRADGTPPVTLIAEFFGSGNLLLVREQRILAAAQSRVWAHRTVRPGAEYRPAPGRPDPWTATAGWLESVLLASTADRVSTLAARAGFGGPLSEELLRRAGLSGTAPAREESGPTASGLRRAVVELLEEVDRGREGYLYRRGASPVDVSPFRSRLRLEDPSLLEEVRASFGRATFEYFTERPVAAPSTPTPDPTRGRLARQLAQQQRAIEALEAEISTRTRAGQRLLERFPEAEAARARLDPSGPEVVATALGDLTVPLHRDRPADVWARELFEEAKRLRTKLEGATGARAATERALASVPEVPVAARASAPTPAAPRRPLWFERFRWFYSSEGILVLAGRDAATNDLLVKKHLRDGDRYLHGDLHGAASVVVKCSVTPGSEPGEATLREAGQFAVVFSKAWRAGHASADAFWVRPDQVSKTAASGEFVARGAWVIHGTKQVLRDLPLEIGLGTEEVDGAARWVAAPEPALRARGELRYRLTPGPERERAEREIELARDLGVSRSLLQGLLPAGGLAIRRA